MSDRIDEMLAQKIRALYALTQELEELLPGRHYTPDGYLIGSIGEVWAAKQYGLTLLLLACLVWTAAGANILRIGLAAYPGHLTALNLLLSAAVFLLFQLLIFGRLVKKHTARITGYGQERQFFLKFFDRKSFAIMAFMMTGGILLRKFLAADGFIAVFYSGLGGALLLAGLLFGRQPARQFTRLFSTL